MPPDQPSSRAESTSPKGPTKYRKKPVVIEAMQWDGTRASIERLCRWVNDRPCEFDDPTLSYTFTTANDVDDVQIWTLEGSHLVSPGDFVIQGVAGEFYACKPDIFDATYEVAS
jgi:hypothetical protein